MESLEVAAPPTDAAETSRQQSVRRAKLVLAAVALLQMMLIYYCIWVHPIQLDLSLSSFRPRDSPVSQRIALRHAIDLHRPKVTDACSSDFEDPNATYTETPHLEWLTLVYKAEDGGNLLQQHLLDQIIALERALVAEPSYEQYCFRGATISRQPLENEPCAPVISIPSIVEIVTEEMSLSNVSISIPDALSYLSSDPANMNKHIHGMSKPIGWFFSSDLKVSPPQYTSVMRAQVLYAVPRNQTAELGRYLIQLKERLLDPANGQGLRVLYSSEFLVTEEVKELLVTDIALVVLSVFVALIVIGIHTRSPFTGVVGTISILLSFPLAYFFYSAVLRFEHMSVLNFLAPFLALGIGCDDTLVLSDGHARLHLLTGWPRLQSALRTTLPAIALTTVTSASAFLMNSLSPLPAVRSFGAFMALTALADLVNTVLIIAPALVIKESLRCQCEPTDDSNGRCAPVVECVATDWVGTRYADMISQRAPWIIVAFIAALGVAIGVCVTFLEVDQAPPAMLPLSHPVQEQNMLLNTAFPMHYTSFLQFRIGVKGVDQSTVDHTDWMDFGEPVYTSDFDPSDAHVQLALVTFEERLVEQFDELRLAKDEVRNYHHGMTQFRGFQTSNSRPFPSTNFFSDFCEYALSNASSNSELWLSNHSATTRGLRGSTFFATGYNINISPMYATGAEVEAVYLKWKRLVSDINARPGCAGLIADTSDLWARIDMDEALLSGATYTPMLSFTVTILLTGAYFLDVVVILSISLCVLCTTASLYVVFLVTGWNIGPLEGLCTTMMVGLSVDYVLHMCIAFSSKEEQTRPDRLKQMLREMSCTVLGSAVTTAGSASVLLFCQVPLFVKVGAIVVCNSMSGALVAVTLLPALLSVAGPTINRRAWCMRRCGLGQSLPTTDYERAASVDTDHEK